jgi:hypothetical protein
VADEYGDDPGISTWRQRMTENQPTVKPWGGPGANNLKGKDKTKPPKKDDKKKTGTATTYEQYLAQQRADEVKAKHKSASKYVHSAQALQGQARALRALLGLPIGKGGLGGGAGGKGGMRNAGPNSQYGVNWQSNWTSKNKDWTRPGQLRGGGLNPGSTDNNGVRTGTDIKYPPGMGSGGAGNNLPSMPPKYGPSGPGTGAGGGGGPRHGTQPPRNADPDDRRPFEDPHRNRRGR